MFKNMHMEQISNTSWCRLPETILSRESEFALDAKNSTTEDRTRRASHIEVPNPIDNHWGHLDLGVIECCAVERRNGNGLGR